MHEIDDLSDSDLPDLSSDSIDLDLNLSRKRSGKIDWSDFDLNLSKTNFSFAKGKNIDISDSCVIIPEPPQYFIPLLSKDDGPQKISVFDSRYQILKLK